MEIGIIGAGIGGLATSALLASSGHDVTLFEQNSQYGGKMNVRTLGDYRFDTGPSLLTMPFLLDKVFTLCGQDMDDYLTLQPLSPLCRYFYQDGVRFDCFSDLPRMLAEIQNFAPEDREAYVQFLGHSADLYNKTAPAFLFNTLDTLAQLKQVPLSDFLKINPFRTVSQVVDRYFESPYLRQFFKRFVTYNGSSPWQAPATLNVIPYVELCLGGYYVKGGIYQIARALKKLGNQQGVQYHFNTGIQKIDIQNGRCKGLKTVSGEKYNFDCIVSNSDATHTYLNLIEGNDLPRSVQKKHKTIEPSCSGFVLLLGIDRQYEQLAHHNVFFSEDYRAEFKAIFKDKKMPDDPTIYVANTSHSDKEHAPDGGSNLFILVNAPYLSDSQNWAVEKREWAYSIIKMLENRGLDRLDEHIVEKEIITPLAFKEQYSANRGSIYGTSSNSKWSAFRRPKNQSPYLKNLYLTGGSTHPGGGIPLVLLSAMNVHSLIRE